MYSRIHSFMHSFIWYIDPWPKVTAVRPSQSSPKPPMYIKQRIPRQKIMINEAFQTNQKETNMYTGACGHQHRPRMNALDLPCLYQNIPPISYMPSNSPTHDVARNKHLPMRGIKGCRNKERGRTKVKLGRRRKKRRQSQAIYPPRSPNCLAQSSYSLRPSRLTLGRIDDRLAWKS